MNPILNEAVQKFIRTAAELLPDLCEPGRMYAATVYENYTILPFAMPKPKLFKDVKDFMEERDDVMLYYWMKNEYGQDCLCAYSNPATGRMFKINAQAQDRNYVFDIIISVYDSLEVMSFDLMDELKRAEQRTVIYKRPFGDFVADFS